MLAARLPIFLVLSTALSTGCMFYSGDDDCEWGGEGGIAADEAPEYVPGQRNPETGTCEYFGGGGGGGGGCDDPCQPCDRPAAEPAPNEPQPSWGYCESHCTGLEEGTCKDTEACRAIYNTDGLYLDCWQTDLSGPVQGGGCDGLDALECSRHDDCAAVHFSTCDSGDSDALQEPECYAESFEACIPETSTIDPGSCDGDVQCESLPPDCPADSTPGIANGCWTGYCIPLASCEDPGPGVCYGEVTCDVNAPLCPAGTLPGIADGCYTGYCIPMDKCEAQPSCSEIVAEATCVGRPDCTPLYEGVDCQCDADGCICAEWIFDSCE